MLDWLADTDVRHKLIASAIVVVVVSALRLLAGRVVRRTLVGDNASRLAWVSRLRLLTGLLLVIGLVFVWATQLQTLALSAVAFAAAIVLATKELILCVTGGIVRNAGNSFRIGDRVEIGAVRGDVIAHGILTTTILETGPGHARTGRAVTIPNSVLVNTPVVNETFTSDYVLHNVRVPLPEGADLAQAEADLLAAANLACEPYVDEAIRHLEEQAAEHGLTAPNARPRVLIQLLDRKAVDLVVRYPAPSRERSRVEQAILRDFLARRGEATAPEPPASG